MKTAIVLLLIVCSTALAHSSHAWIKQSEHYGRDAWGNKILICNWQCTLDFNNPHYATTQGQSWCPMPF